MAGYTDSAFRQLVKKFGSDLIWTEMVSATALKYQEAKVRAWLAQGYVTDCPFDKLDAKQQARMEGNLSVLRYASVEHPIIMQLFGKVPEHFELAARLAVEMGFDGIDINMGCPAKKVVGSFHGCSLMKDINLAREIVKATREGSLGAKLEIRNPKSETNSKFEIQNSKHRPTVSVKIRSGWDTVTAPEFAAAMQEAGIDFVTVHARTKQQGYRGKADWDVIREVVEAVTIPVIGNGDVIDGASARAMLEHTSCAGVMVGRGVIGRPWVFREIQETFQRSKETKKQENTQYPISSIKYPDIIPKFGHHDFFPFDLALEHCRLLVETKGEKRGMLQARKHLAWYVRGLPGARELRSTLVQVDTFDQAREIFTQTTVGESEHGG
jgi:tRNA-dihydrouridine synthase B